MSRIEKLGNFVIIWLKKTYPHNKKFIGIPIYSTAFDKIDRADFISTLNAKILPETDFYQTIETPIID